jgi:hypothetical protein
MAELRITVGAVTEAVETSDANAAQLVADYVAAYGGPVSGTSRERLGWFIRHVAAHVAEVGEARALTTALEVERERLREGRQTLRFAVKK